MAVLLFLTLKIWRSQTFCVILRRFSERRAVIYVSRDGLGTEPTEPYRQVGHGGKKDTN